MNIIAWCNNQQLQVQLFTERNQIPCLVLILSAESLINCNKAERRVTPMFGQAKLICNSRTKNSIS